MEGTKYVVIAQLKLVYIYIYICVCVCVCVCVILGSRSAKAEVIFSVVVAPCGSYFLILTTVAAGPSETSVHGFTLHRVVMVFTH